MIGWLWGCFFNRGMPEPETAQQFCERVYRETRGVTPELRRAYDFYLANYRAGDSTEREDG